MSPFAQERRAGLSRTCFFLSGAMYVFVVSVRVYGAFANARSRAYEAIPPLVR